MLILAALIDLTIVTMAEDGLFFFLLSLSMQSEVFLDKSLLVQTASLNILRSSVLHLQ